MSLVLSLFFIPNGAYIVAVIPIVLACVCSTGILFVPKVSNLCINFFYSAINLFRWYGCTKERRHLCQMHYKKLLRKTHLPVLIMFSDKR